MLARLRRGEASSIDALLAAILGLGSAIGMIVLVGRLFDGSIQNVAVFPVLAPVAALLGVGMAGTCGLFVGLPILLALEKLTSLGPVFSKIVAGVFAGGISLPLVSLLGDGGYSSFPVDLLAFGSLLGLGGGLLAAYFSRNIIAHD